MEDAFTLNLKNLNESIKQEQERICEQALIVGLAVIAMQGRKEDDVSENEAFKLYGKKWIQSRANAGLIHFNRIGSTVKSAKFYSRFEIESLKQAEKHIEQKMIQANNVVEKLKTKTEK